MSGDPPYFYEMSGKLSAYVGLVCSGAVSCKFASDTTVRRHAEHLWERPDNEGDGLERGG
jgi:hypothetical protein